MNRLCYLFHHLHLDIKRGKKKKNTITEKGVAP